MGLSSNCVKARQDIGSKLNQWPHAKSALWSALQHRHIWAKNWINKTFHTRGRIAIWQLTNVSNSTVLYAAVPYSSWVEYSPIQKWISYRSSYQETTITSLRANRRTAYFSFWFFVGVQNYVRVSVIEFSIFLLRPSYYLNEFMMLILRRHW